MILNFFLKFWLAAHGHSTNKPTNPNTQSPHTLQPNKLTKHKLSQTLDKKWATTTSCATLSPRSKSESPLGPD